jgi:hypothetical protein
MQSRAIAEMIQESAQFCAMSFSDSDDGMGLARPLTLRRLANRQQRPRHAIRATVRPAAMLPKITVFSDTCLKSCDRWARLGHVS